VCGRRRDPGLGGGKRLGPGLRAWRGRLDDRPSGQERQRIDVALILGRHPHAEVDERLRAVDDAARPDRPDNGAFGDERSALHADRAEMDERGRVPERRLDRDGLAPVRHGSGERDGASRRREHLRAGRCAQVDATVLTPRVRVRTVERERPQDGTIDRPCPGLRCRRRQEQGGERNDGESAEHEASLLPDLRTERP
jgi:hypothetical protein